LKSEEFTMKLKVSHLGIIFSIVIIISFALIATPISFLENQKNDAKIINLVGKQRMLSQVISSGLYRQKIDSAGTSAGMQEVVKALNQFEKTHRAVLSGDDDLGMPPTASKAISSQHQRVDGIWKDISTSIRLISSTSDTKSLDNAIATITLNNDSLLLELNSLVKIFENEAHTKVGKLDSLLKNLAIPIFFCLLAGFLGGFRVLRNLKESVRLVRLQAKELDAASGSLSLASHSLSASSVEQESAVQETVASMTEINGIVSKNTSNTDECLQSTKITQDKIDEGGTIIDSMVKSVNDIDRSIDDLDEFKRILREVESKTQVINDIVVKTQLLSVNASIEAERAGEYGVGFGVVAEEIGKLAINSGSEAKGIKTLLEDSLNQVNQIVSHSKKCASQGIETCERSREIFTSIGKQVKMIGQQVGDVSEASRQQEIGVREVTSAMKTMSDAIHHNSASARSCAELASSLTSGSKTLEELAHRVSEIVGVHKEGRTVISHTEISTRGPNEMQNKSPSTSTVRSLIEKTKKIDSPLLDANEVSADDEIFSDKVA